MSISNHKLSFNVSAMLLSGAFQFALAFGSNLVLVRLLTPKDFGEFSYKLAIATIAAVILNFRIGDYVARTSLEELKENRHTLSKITMLQITCVFVASACLLNIFSLLDTTGFLILMSLLISPVVTLYMGLYERNYSYGKIAKLESLAFFSSHAIALILAFLNAGVLALYMRVLSLPVFIFIGLLYCGGISKLQFGFPTISQIKLVYSNTKWNWLDGTLEQLIDRLITVAAKAVMSFSELGFFYQARRIATIPHQLLAPATTRVFLRYSADMVPRLRFHFLLKTLLAEVLFLGLMVLLFYQFGEFLINVLFGPQWSILYDVVLALGGVILATSPYNTLKAHYISENKVKEFIFFGRLPFAISLMVIGTILFNAGLGLSPLSLVALTISGAYICSTIVLLFHSRYRQKRHFPTQYPY